MTNIKKYEQACVAIAEDFSAKYCDNDEHYFVAGELGGVCGVGDIHLDAHDMVLVLKLDPTVEEFYEAYFSWVEQECEVSLHNLIRYGKRNNEKN